MRDDDGPAKRIVLLGASNLTRGISTVIETAWSLWGSPLEVLAALGHGRSYGLRSRVLGRELPGIRRCGLWDDLAARPPADTAALVTDVGNDLLYGASVSEILGWVSESLDRLASHHARTILTLLPLESVESLSDWRYWLLRTCTFPRCRAGRLEILEAAIELNAGLKQLAAEHGAATVELPGRWYGFDPIHIRLASLARSMARDSLAVVRSARERGSSARIALALALSPLAAATRAASVRPRHARLATERTIAQTGRRSHCIERRAKRAKRRSAQTDRRAQSELANRIAHVFPLRSSFCVSSIFSKVVLHKF